MNSGRVSFTRNSLPIVRGLLKVNLKSAYGYRWLKSDNNFPLIRTESLVKGRETYIIFLGTVHTTDFGLKILSKNSLTILLSMLKG